MNISMFSKPFFNKVVIITGSSSGIGRSTAIKFAQGGARVVITGRSSERVEETIVQCIAAGARPSDLLDVCGDVMDDNFCDELINKTIRAFGKLNILINNAGTLELDPNGKEGWEMSVDVMDKSMKSNFRSVLVVTQKAIPYLIRTKGDIVNVSTFLSSGPLGVMSMPYYAIPKAALDQMSRSMAHEYILKGVRVNTVNPGLVSTSFFARIGVGEAIARQMEEYVSSKPEYIPLGRVATSEDVSETILFLADRERSECIVGQSIIIDGGSRLCCNIDMSDFKEKMK